MKEPVVITEGEYAKGEKIFGDAAGRIEWKVSSQDERSVAEAVAASGARIAVVGIEKYQGPLYEALEANAKGKPALIVRYGVGYDSINLEKCKGHNVILAITAGTLDRSVAEHTLALMLACARNVPFLDTEVRSGRFTGRQGFELAGKTLGLVGLGHIGKFVAKMAAFGFGMKVVVYDVLPLEKASAAESLGTEDFKTRYGIAEYHTEYGPCAAAADILSLHMPVLPSTIKFMNKERLGRLKNGALFINTSRGRLVDEADLYDALLSGRIAGAGLDVFEKEPYVPVSPDKDLRKLPNVVLTSHTASNTFEANAAMQRVIVGNIDAYAAGDLARLTAVKIP
jgi:lactate dehydrogenase-like 2-hydroxyacid dehydrogenase